MSFDARSLERLRSLGRQLPQKLAEPQAELQSPTPAKQKRHKIETEDDPQALFRELMQVSPDGSVPEHMLARLKSLEARSTAAPDPSASMASAEAPNPLAAGAASSPSKGKTTQPNRPKVTPGSEEERLYVAFGQLLLEDDEDNG